MVRGDGRTAWEEGERKGGVSAASRRSDGGVKRARATAALSSSTRRSSEQGDAVWKVTVMLDAAAGR